MKSFMKSHAVDTAYRSHYGYQPPTQPLESFDNINLSTFHSNRSGVSRQTQPGAPSLAYLQSQDVSMDSLPQNQQQHQQQREPASKPRRSCLCRLRGDPRVKWYRRKGLLRSLRSCICAMKIPAIFFLGGWGIGAILSLTWASGLMLWDIIYWADLRWNNAFSLTFEINTYVECLGCLTVLAGLGVDFYYIAWRDSHQSNEYSTGYETYTGHYYYDERITPSQQAGFAVTELLSFLVLGITWLFSYRWVRRFKEHRRIYIHSKPIIVFRPNGDPVAVITDDSAVLRSDMARRSVDSLLQHSGDASPEGSPQRIVSSV